MFNPTNPFSTGTGFDVPTNMPHQMQQPWSMGQAPEQEPEHDNTEESEISHRPPNAFILYTQEMRSSVRQENPNLSNTECSKLLGKMWKEVPNELKLQYKAKASALQEEFKRQHPDYTYRKARRKRALNELLTKSTQGYNGIGAPNYLAQEMNSWQTMMQQNPTMMQQVVNSQLPQYAVEFGQGLQYQTNNSYPYGQLGRHNQQNSFYGL
jgi:hypothetical protein